MRKLLLLTLILIVLCQAKAQETHHYLSRTTEYRDSTGKPICCADGNETPGTYKITKGLICFDMSRANRKVYTIINRGKWEPYDEGYSFKEMKVCELAGPDRLVFCRVLILRDPSGVITDITVRYQDKDVSYRTRPYKHNEWGYKLAHVAKLD